MSETVKTPLKLFYCYSHKDKDLRDALDDHLSSLKRQGLIEVWHDGEISPGSKWEQEIETSLGSADIVLLLISSAFLASDYAYSKEMIRALDRHKAGTVQVVPILLRPVDWEDEPFSILQVLPTEAKPVTRWQHPDDAYEDIAKKLRTMVKALQAQRKTLAQQWSAKGYDFGVRKQYQKALEAYSEALRLDPSFAVDYNGKGAALNGLKRYEEALEAYSAALWLDPSYALAYNNKGNALNDLKRNEEALEAYSEALRLNPSSALAYNGKGVALHDLKRYEEALEAYSEALRLDPSYALAYYNMASTLDSLGRTREAQQAREKARQLGFS